jgi:hypothetical protein
MNKDVRSRLIAWVALIERQAADGDNRLLVDADVANEHARDLRELLCGSPIRPGQTVECIDAWDTFNALTVGKTYEVLDTRDGMIFVRGNTGHIGGWWPSHFKVVDDGARRAEGLQTYLAEVEREFGGDLPGDAWHLYLAKGLSPAEAAAEHRRIVAAG